MLGQITHYFFCWDNSLFLGQVILYFLTFMGAVTLFRMFSIFFLPDRPTQNFTHWIKKIKSCRLILILFLFPPTAWKCFEKFPRTKRSRNRGLIQHFLHGTVLSVYCRDWWWTIFVFDFVLFCHWFMLTCYFCGSALFQILYYSVIDLICCFYGSAPSQILYYFVIDLTCCFYGSALSQILYYSVIDLACCF